MLVFDRNINKTLQTGSVASVMFHYFLRTVCFPVPTKVLCRQAPLGMPMILGTRKKPEHRSEGFSHLMYVGITWEFC